MITQFNDFNAQHELTTPPISDQEKIVQEYLGTFERRMLILENPWNFDVFNGQSVKPFLKNLGNLISKDIKVGHRFIDSKQGLSYYIKHPGGLIWENPATYGCTAFVFETHGSKQNGMELPVNNVNKQDILDNCTGFKESPNILYFGGCGMFAGQEGNQFGWDLLQASGSRGIFGFSSENVSFAIGTLISLHFLSMFYLSFDLGDPFEHLPDIYSSFISEYPVAASEDVGFTMFFEEG